MYRTKILLDSINVCGQRLTTWELTYPRFVHSELMTHRLFSRNSASSRAIPNKKMLENIKNDPVLPVWWGKNQAGMQAKEELDLETREKAIKLWLEARDLMVEKAEEMAVLNVHKQIINRITEPWMFITVLMTATEHDNWWALRCHADAQPEIKWVADDMFKQYRENKPQVLEPGEWHLPLIMGLTQDQNDDDTICDVWDYVRDTFGDVLANTERVNDILKKISTGRCARVSYLTHDGKRDFKEDIKLHDRLLESNHWSPFEHAAEALDEARWIGNFVGWKQYRKFFNQEHIGGSMEQRGYKK
jgi:thymidylate synthase ThyX